MHQSFITSIYLTATTLKHHIIKERINLKHEETQLILSEKQLIGMPLCICVPACTPLNVHVEAVHTAFCNTLYSVFSSGRRCPDVPKTECLQAAIMTSLQSCELWLAFSLASGRHQPVSTDETGPIIVSFTAKVNKTGKDQRLQRCGLKGTVRKTQDLECVNSLKRTLPGIKV